MRSLLQTIILHWSDSMRAGVGYLKYDNSISRAAHHALQISDWAKDDVIRVPPRPREIWRRGIKTVQWGKAMEVA